MNIKKITGQEYLEKEMHHYEAYRNLADRVLEQALEDAFSGEDLSEFIGSEIYDLYLATSHIESSRYDKKIRQLNKENVSSLSRIRRGVLIAGTAYGKRYEFLSYDEATRKTGVSNYMVKKSCNGDKIKSKWTFEHVLNY